VSAHAPLITFFVLVSLPPLLSNMLWARASNSSRKEETERFPRDGKFKVHCPSSASSSAHLPPLRQYVPFRPSCVCVEATCYSSLYDGGGGGGGSELLLVFPFN